MSNKRKFQRKPRISGNTNLLTTKSIKSNIKNPMTGTDDRSQCPTGTPDSQCGCCCFLVPGNEPPYMIMGLSEVYGGSLPSFEDRVNRCADDRNGNFMPGACINHSGIGNACPYTYGTNGTNEFYYGNFNDAIGCDDPSAMNYNPNSIIGY